MDIKVSVIISLMRCELNLGQIPVHVVSNLAARSVLERLDVPVVLSTILIVMLLLGECSVGETIGPLDPVFLGELFLQASQALHVLWDGAL